MHTHGIARAAAGFVIGFALGAPMSAQTVHGRVLGADDVPVSGVVVFLVRDTSSIIAARALSDDHGEFTMGAAGAGTFRLETRRIGFLPTATPLFGLAAGQVVNRRIVLTGLRVLLDTVRVTDRGGCRFDTRAANAAFLLWDQARTALTAAELTAGDRTLAVTTLTYDRTYDSELRDLRAQRAHVRADYVMRIWRSVPSESLHVAGYVVKDSIDGSTTYRAPSLETLLSSSFLTDHCFHLVERAASTGDSTGDIGLMFEPTLDRQRMSEIRGTIWLDRHTAELRELEFQYENIPRPERDRGGGSLAFTRLRDGAWAVWSWSIRMPVVVQERLPGSAFGGSTRLAEVQVTGGELSLVRRGSDTLWVHPPVPLLGTVVDSASGEPVVGARVMTGTGRLLAMSGADGRFVASDLIPGDDTLRITTPALDSARAAARVPVTVIDGQPPLHVRIPVRTLAASGTILVGKVLADSTKAPIAGAEISVPELGRIAVSLQDGSFKLDGIVAGRHRLVVRRVGYGPLDTLLSFAARRTIDRTIYLSPVVTLDPVNVNEKAIGIPSFDEHRHVGLGHFLTRADLAKAEDLKLQDILAQLPSAHILRGHGTHSWLVGRSNKSIAGHLQALSPEDVVIGARVGACYSQVYLDYQLIYRGTVMGEPLFDLTSIPVSAIEAVEYYAGPSETPPEYSGLDSPCGVLVIWTRRTP